MAFHRKHNIYKCLQYLWSQPTWRLDINNKRRNNQFRLVEIIFNKLLINKGFIFKGLHFTCLKPASLSVSVKESSYDTSVGYSVSLLWKIYVWQGPKCAFVLHRLAFQVTFRKCRIINWIYVVNIGAVLTWEWVFVKLFVRFVYKSMLKKE